MGQLNFLGNFFLHGADSIAMINGSLSFVPFQVWDSMSLLTINLFFDQGNANKTFSISLGLYSISGVNLSLYNSGSVSKSISSGRGWISITDFSATQNISPGTWWFGILPSTAGNSSVSLMGLSTLINPANAFPGGFIHGNMSVSTAALPGSYATSDLDITGLDALATPMILLSA